jgi:hypothetical protein
MMMTENGEKAQKHAKVTLFSCMELLVRKWKWQKIAPQRNLSTIIK